MYDVVAIGESLIDFTPSGQNKSGVDLFGCNPGGAPVNLLAMYAKSGGKTAFIGKVGDDNFGHFLGETMDRAGIDITDLIFTKEAPTTLAFVHLDNDGERSFSFYRKHSADIMLRTEDLPIALLGNCHVFHFGSVSMSDEPSRSATITAVMKAKDMGAIISYDPNYRPPLWKCETEAMEIMRNACPLADLIKVSYEEMKLITGNISSSAGAQKLLAYGASLVVVTGGERGCFYATPTCNGFVPSYRVSVVDTTGSGDAFMGSLLFKLKALSKAEIANLKQEVLEEYIRYANAAGGLTATVRGAIPALPTKEDIICCMNEKPVHDVKLII